MRHVRLLIPVIVCGAFVVGCGARHRNAPQTTQGATDVSLATTQPAYWLDQPATAAATAADFQRLWDASEDVARDFLFRLDRQDYRAGVLTTRPMVSAQWFEPWRREVRSWDDRAESSLATIRRSVRFEFERVGEGDAYRVTPNVLVERQTLAEQRITSVVAYRQFFTRPVRPELRQRGTRESDVGIFLPNRYWYPTGRDAELERALAEAIQKKVKK